MKIKGNGFRYFINDKEVRYKDLQTMIRLDMTVQIDGLNVYYSSPKKVKDRLLLAEEFKKKALDEMYFKNPNFKKEQVSQACYTSSEEVKELHRICMEQIHNLLVSEGFPPIVIEKFIKAETKNSAQKENKTATQQIKEKQEKYYSNKLTVSIFNGDIKPVTFYNSFSTIKEVMDYLERITYTSYTIFNGDKKISWGTNHKQINMNRLIEEELERQEQQDWDSRIDSIIDAFTEAEKRGGTIRRKPSLTVGIEEITKIMTEGKKENNGKIDYSEVDFDILDLMANRFNANKHKYPQGNMLKPIEEKQLLFALLRHLKKMIQPVDNDPETFEEHLSAILCNAQMVYQQRKINKN